MITRRGVGLLIVAVVGFFVASATRVGWLHLATALLAGALLFSALFPQLTLFGLRAHAGFLAHRRKSGDLAPIAGEKLEIEVGVENRSFWPRFFVAAIPTTTMDRPVENGMAKPGVLFASVQARSTSVAVIEAVAGIRGRQRITEVALECRAPFGLFRARRRRRAGGETLVYPAWLPLRSAKLLEAMRGERSGRRAVRRGDEVASSRRYIVGDALRDVHWKNTARTGRPMVREFDSGMEEALTIVFETGAVLGSGADSTLEYAITLAASVSRIVIGRGGAIQMVVDGRMSDPMYEWTDVMRELALVEPTRAMTLVDALTRAPTGGRLLAIVSAAHQSQISAVGAAARRGAAVACIVLEGFAPGDNAFAAVESLRRVGCAALACRKGGLPAAAAAIENGYALADTPADATQKGRAA